MGVNEQKKILLWSHLESELMLVALQRDNGEERCAGLSLKRLANLCELSSIHGLLCTMSTVSRSRQDRIIAKLSSAGFTVYRQIAATTHDADECSAFCSPFLTQRSRLLTLISGMTKSMMLSKVNQLSAQFTNFNVPGEEISQSSVSSQR
ncbi:hypothetical protein Plhal304r1_c009g0035181 [Plasmopara halstedii]